MNVLFVDQFSVLGGAQQCFLDLLPAMEAKGWTVRAALPGGGPLGELLRARGVRVDEIPAGAYGCGKKSAGDVLQFAADVLRQTAAIGAMVDESDLVYVNGPRLLVAAGLAARGRAPILFHAHHRIEQRGARCVEGLALRQSGAVVAACCEAVAEPLRKWAAHVEVIANGTADLGFVERDFGRREKRVGMIGRIAPDKGQVEFLRAAAGIDGVRWVVCGAPLFGERAYYNEVLKMASGLPVEFLDWQEDVGAVMRDLDVLVIASKREGMPRVLLEAFSAGLPVVAIGVGGIPETIEDGVTGFLTRGGLEETLQKVLKCDAGELGAVAARARREWESRYTLGVYRERITDLMERCVRRPGRETAEPRGRRRATRR